MLFPKHLHKELSVTANTPAGSHAQDGTAQCLANASGAIAEAGGEGPIAKYVNNYALQRGLNVRSVVLLHLLTIKHIINKCDCFLVCVCE